MVERVISKRRAAKLKSISLDEISLVDRPANPHAVVTLFKRVDDDPVEKKYKVIGDLPKAVRDSIPTSAQHQFLAVFNSAKDGKATDQSAFQQAWGALKNAGWSKNKEGKWVKKSEDIDKAATKLEDGKNFRAGDYAYVPDASKPSTWKLRLTTSPGGAPNSRIVGAAAAAFSPGGHRGQKVQIPPAAVAGVKAKIRAAWRRANPDADPKTMPASIRKDAYYDGGSYPTAVAEQVSAVDFDTVLAEQEAREAAAEVGEDLREKWCALQRSFSTIAADESVSAQDKITQMRASLQQYIDSLSEQSTEIADSMTKAITTAVPAVAELLEKDGYEAEEENEMSAAEKKQLDELQKTVDELTEKLAAATADDQAKKSAELQEALTKAQSEVKELTEKMEKSAADSEEAVAKASMSDAEKQYMAGLSGAKKMEFMRATAAERKSMMSKAAEDDPVVYKGADGTEFRKSDDQRLVAMAKRNDDLEKRNAEEVEKRLVAEFEKKADEEPYKVLKGDVSERSRALRAISAIEDEAVRKTVTDWIETCGKLMAKSFETVGHQDEKVRKTAEDFNKRVSEVMKRDSISRARAMSKAAKEYPEEYEAYQAAGQAS